MKRPKLKQPFLYAVCDIDLDNVLEIKHFVNTGKEAGIPMPQGGLLVPVTIVLGHRRKLSN